MKILSSKVSPNSELTVVETKLVKFLIQKAQKIPKLYLITIFLKMKNIQQDL